jgi:hypothetical protein
MTRIRNPCHPWAIPQFDMAENTLPRAGRFWLVRMLGMILLLVQSAALLSGGILNIGRAPHLVRQLLRGEWAEAPAPEAVDALAQGLIFHLLAGALMLAALGFLIRLRGGWLLGMLLQGFTLYFCLSLYFNRVMAPAIYLIMLYSIVVVFFLNSAVVRRAFAVRSASARPRLSHEQ